MTNDSSLVLPTSNADSKCATDSSFRNKICCALISVVLFLAIIILPLSLKKVGSTEFGISYTKYSKQLDDAARSGGLYTGPPGFKFIKFPSLYITADLPESTCVSKDGLRVNYDVTFQYRMEERDLKPAILKYLAVRMSDTVAEVCTDFVPVAQQFDVCGIHGWHEHRT